VPLLDGLRAPVWHTGLALRADRARNGR